MISKTNPRLIAEQIVENANSIRDEFLEKHEVPPVGMNPDTFVPLFETVIRGKLERDQGLPDLLGIILQAQLDLNDRIDKETKRLGSVSWETISWGVKSQILERYATYIGQNPEKDWSIEQSSKSSPERR